jgi:hypothetical protein
MEDCAHTTAGKSKYCWDHREEAHHRFVDMVREQKAERDERNAKWKDLFAEAQTAGQTAALAHYPTPMIVEEHTDMLDDDSPVRESWHVPDGVCGVAWVTLHPGNCSAALYAKKHLGAKKAYEGGMSIWVSDYNQSMERKYVHAKAFAAVLNAAGVEAHAHCRRD